MSSGDQLCPCTVCGGLGHWESSHAGDAKQAALLQYWLTKPNYSPVEVKNGYMFSSGNVVLGRGLTAVEALEDAMNNVTENNKMS